MHGAQSGEENLGPSPPYVMKVAAPGWSTTTRRGEDVVTFAGVAFGGGARFA
jgi:hypothetical protein